ncbi:hypothetical protein SteCoe_36857 [Stentor coeruleus]|uniref:Uncharacterized protein n=1 Tax=Stentor coeruleus TaxID=5963 RepID=A0A1R2APC3_9CILI|nr:hypothetical protein SteCoe_36857 [Stentor coeruleus]
MNVSNGEFRRKEVCKVLTLGNSSVGKTSIIMRFTENMFSYKFMTTIGVNFKEKEIAIGNRLIFLQVWDTAGQERFRNLQRNYYKGAHGILLVYDVTSLESFNNISKWIEDIEENAPQNTVKVLVGNKVDMINHRVVDEESGRSLAAKYSMKYFETSAKDQTGVVEVFDYIAKKVYSLLSISPSYLNHTPNSIMLKAKAPKKEKRSWCS